MALRRPHKGMKTGWCRERATTRVAPTTGLPEPILRGMTGVEVVSLTFVRMTNCAGMTTMIPAALSSGIANEYNDARSRARPEAQ